MPPMQNIALLLLLLPKLLHLSTLL